MRTRSNKPPRRGLGRHRVCWIRHRPLVIFAALRHSAPWHWWT